MNSLPINITCLLNLRRKQLGRIISQTGIGLIVVCLILISGVALQFLDRLLLLPAESSMIAWPLLLFFIDLNRSDKIFLKSIFNSWQSAGFYCGIEYVLLSSPFIAYQYINKNWLVGTGLLLASLIVGLTSPYIRSTKNKAYKKSLSFIPLRFFEIRFLLEKQKIWLVVLILFALGGIFHFGFLVVALFFFILFLPEAFRHLEPIEMANLRHQFLWQKLKINTGLAGAFWVFPFLLSYLFGGLPLWVGGYGLLCIFTALTLSIGYKYSHFNGIHGSLSSSTLLAFLTLIMLVPGGILITIGFCFYYFKKANDHLKRFYVTD